MDTTKHMHITASACDGLKMCTHLTQMVACGCGSPPQGSQRGQLIVCRLVPEVNQDARQACRCGGKRVMSKNCESTGWLGLQQLQRHSNPNND